MGEVRLATEWEEKPMMGTAWDDDHRARVLMMIEKMQRDGHPEASIHEAVRRVTRSGRSQRQQRRPGDRWQLFRMLRRRS
jgi:hypothetical protein